MGLNSCSEISKVSYGCSLQSSSGLWRRHRLHRGAFSPHRCQSCPSEIFPPREFPSKFDSLGRIGLNVYSLFSRLANITQRYFHGIFISDWILLYGSVCLGLSTETVRWELLWGVFCFALESLLVSPPGVFYVFLIFVFAIWGLHFSNFKQNFLIVLYWWPPRYHDLTPLDFFSGIVEGVRPTLYFIRNC